MMSETVLLTIGLSCVSALLVVALVARFRRKLSSFSKVPILLKLVLLVCGVSFYLHGSLKTNNTTNATSPMMFAARPSIQTTEFINQTEMYVNAWNATGVWEDSFWCRFENDFVFPYGTNHLKGVEVLAWGEIWSTHRKDAVLADLGEKVAIGRGISRFSCEYFAASETNEAKYVYSWYNGLVNRETNSVINGRIELRRSGDILVATNGVERFIPRQLPFEYNGFGQDDEWVAANFTNASEILSVGYSEWVDDQVGVNLTNGLYKLTVTVPEKPLETTQLNVGDYSVAVTNAGEYVFLLEKGVNYPLSFYGDMDNLVYEWDDGGGGEMPTAYNLPRNRSNYSVEVSSYCDLDNPVYFNSPMDDGEGFILYHPIVTISPSYEVDPVEPLCLFAFVSDNIFSPYAEIKWIANDRVIGTGEMLFLYDLSQYSYIKVEVRHRDSLIEGSVYINRYVRDTLVNLSSGGVIVTEGAYTNAPNEVVSASSTSVDLNINYQLTEGGEFRLECEEDDGLEVRDETGSVVTLPLEWNGYYNEDVEKTYSVAASDINATGTKTFTLTYTPYFEEEPIIRQINIDVVKIRVEAEADWPSNKVRHVFGPGETAIITQEPLSPKLIFDKAMSNGGRILADGSSWKVLMSQSPSELVATGAFVGENRYDLKLRVIPPSSLRGENARPLTDIERNLHNLQPGNTIIPSFNSDCHGVLMYIDVVCEPLYVSFENIKIYEGIAPTSNRTGCFSDYDAFPEESLAHGVGNGAVVDYSCATSLQEGNYLSGGDCVGFWFWPNGVYNQGSYELAIPQYWFAEGESQIVPRLLTTSIQKVWVYSSGAIRVQKHGKSLQRELNGSIHQVGE